MDYQLKNIAEFIGTCLLITYSQPMFLGWPLKQGSLFFTHPVFFYLPQFQVELARLLFQTQAGFLFDISRLPPAQ